MTTLSKNFLKPDWRLSHLYRIVNKQSKLVRFQPNAIQRVVNRITAPRKMILKPRQIGSTTNEVLKLLDATLFRRNVTSCIMAHESDAIKKIFRIPRRAYNHLNSDIKPRIDRGGGSKYEMVFPDINSLIYCDLESRGDTISRLHISEAAFVDHERYISTMQAVPSNGRVTIESTPYGVGNWFYDMWHEDNEYEKLFFPWYLDIGYQLPLNGKVRLTKDEKLLTAQAKRDYDVDLTPQQILWRRNKLIELKDHFFQEYPEDPETCFLLSGGSVIDRNFVRQLMKEALPNISDNDHTKIFKPHDKTKHYAIGADTAQGTGNDYCAAVCFEIETMTEVASLRGKWPPVVFARKLNDFARIFTMGYNSPIIAVEANNHGHAVLLELGEHLLYPNIYCAKKDQAGWITNATTRPIMVDQFIGAVEDGAVKINTAETFGELLTLVNTNGKIEAASGKHDDLFMASAIGWQMVLKEAGRVKLYENVGGSILV